MAECLTLLYHAGMVRLLRKGLLKSVWLFVHNVIMIGSPGAGKTLLARAMPGILPEMSIDESLDVTRIYSIADQLPVGMPLIRHRPFRAPHHTISHAGLVGGGNIPKPGEISLAHRGTAISSEADAGIKSAAPEVHAKAAYLTYEGI